MKSLARSNVGFHWRLFLSAVSVLALSGCLIYVAVGISAANIRSFSTYQRSLDVDLYIRSTGRDSVSLQKLLTEVDLYEDIIRAEPYLGRTRPQQVRLDDEVKQLSIAEIELGEDVILVPRFISSEAKEALSVPGTIIVSSTLKEKNDFKMGDVLWNSDDSFGLEIIGFFDAAVNRGFIGARTGYGFVSPETGRLFSPSTPRAIHFGGGVSRNFSRISMVGVRIPPDTSPEIVKQRLNQQFKGASLEAITPQEMGRRTSLDAILESKQFQGFLVVGVFAVLIPLFIIVQTLRSAILTQSQQFATMRALGIPSRHLVSTAMEQAFWVGTLGIGVSYCVMLGVKAGLLGRGIDMYVTSTVVWYVSAAILLAALIAGVISLTAIFKMKPQDLLR